MRNQAISSIALSLSLASGVALAQTSFDINDVNNDDKLSRDEFYGVVSDAGIYPDWDTDGDGLINEVEYEIIGVDADFVVWDRNGDAYLNDRELYDGVYGYFDENEDGHWDGQEWDDAGDAGWLDI